MMDRCKTTVMILGVVSLSLLFLSSCHEREELPGNIASNEISLIISEGEPYTQSTKGQESVAVSKPASLLLVESEQMGEIYLSVTESSIHTGLVDTINNHTKGVPYDETNNVSKFNLTSYLYPNTTTKYLSVNNLSYDGTNPVSTGYYWPITDGNVYMSFFGHISPDQGTLTTPEYVLTTGETNYSSHKGLFEYTLPSPNATNTDAQSQSDLIFAITANQTKPESGTYVNLKFYHALSSIVFTVGTVPSQFKVGKITIENVHPNGSCTYTHLSGGAIDFVWTLPSGTPETDYTQTFNKEIGSAAVNTLINEPSETFMMIPQTITESTNLKVQFYFGDREYTISKKLSELTSEWKPGKKYTYRISAIEEVDIELDDKVSEDKYLKSDLTIKNKGLAPVYVRAMILGEWFTGSGESELVVAQWNKDTDGHFTGLNTTSWLYSTKDGYYYYKYPLNKNATADALFESYLLDTTPPVLDAELKLYIATQAIVTSKVENVWGEIVAKNTSTGELTLK